MNRRWRTRVLVLLCAGLAAWVAADLFAPRTSSLRRFDADEVARLETAMWRSYYDKRKVALFRDMTALLRREYHLPPLRAAVVGFDAARAAFVFKRGHGRTDYERALPDLRRYYRALREVSDTPFDVERAARLELEWWIVHRERKQHAPGDLARALADLQAELYGLPAERFDEHARLRAEAMTIRDDQAAAGGVTDADWGRIDALLRDSYRALHAAVNG